MTLKEYLNALERLSSTVGMPCSCWPDETCGACRDLDLLRSGWAEGYKSGFKAALRGDEPEIQVFEDGEGS